MQQSNEYSTFPIDIEKLLADGNIIKITGDSFYMVGDNQTQIEGPLRADQVRGKMIGFVRNGKFTNVQNPSYRFFSSLWLFLRPIRPLAWKLMKQLRKAFKALTPTKKK